MKFPISLAERRPALLQYTWSSARMRLNGREFVEMILPALASSSPWSLVGDPRTAGTKHGG